MMRFVQMLKTIVKDAAYPLTVTSLKRAYLPIFLLHDIVAAGGDHSFGNNDSLTPAEFQLKLRSIKKHFKPIKLTQALALARSGESLEGCCCLTFDDGFAGISNFGFDILDAEDFPATVFLIGNLIEKPGSKHWIDCYKFIRQTGRWNLFLDAFPRYAQFHPIKNCYQKNASFPAASFAVDITQFFSSSIDETNDEDSPYSGHYLTRENLAAAPSCVDFGNHGFEHLSMASLTKEETFDQISRSHEVLRKIPQFKPLLSLPFGSNNAHVENEAKRIGYSCILQHTGRPSKISRVAQSPFLDRVNLTDVPQNLAWNAKFRKLKCTHD